MTADASRELWWEHSHNIADLLEWLDEQGELGEPTIKHVVDVLRKPWHWTREFNQMLVRRAK